jgi:hypothetical protein
MFMGNALKMNAYIQLENVNGIILVLDAVMLIVSFAVKNTKRLRNENSSLRTFIHPPN